MKLDSSLLQRAIPDGSMRYFAWLYTASEYRDVIAAVFLLELELRDTARAPHDVAHIRLQWWRDEIERLSKGKAQHPATVVLQSTGRSSTDFSTLEPLILCCAQDIAHSTYESDTELQQYFSNCGTLARTVTMMMTDSPAPSVLEAAEKLGAFVRQVETLRDIKLDVHHGYLYLPLDELDKLDVEYESLASDHWPTPFVEWLTSRCRTVLQNHRTLLQALLASERSQLRPLIVLASLHERLLQKMVAEPKNFLQRLELGPFLKLWTAWRAARLA